MYKKFVRNTLMMTVALLIVCGSAIFAIDPYYHYHTPWFGLQATPFQERYCNAGLAEHFDYDSVIIGSSMTENFRASWFDVPSIPKRSWRRFLSTAGFAMSFLGWIPQC